MNIDVLTYPPELVPDGVDPEAWIRWLKGTRAFDELWGKGARCPSGNSNGAACTCERPREKLCQIWQRLEDVSLDVGQTEIMRLAAEGS